MLRTCAKGGLTAVRGSVKLIGGAASDRARSPGIEISNKLPVNCFAADGNREVPIPRVQVRIQEWEGKGLLDTGSTHSLISAQIFKGLHNLPRGSVSQVNWQTQLLNGETCSALYKANLHIIVAGRHIKHNMYVMENMAIDVIIGTEIIQKMGIVPILDMKGFTFADQLATNPPIVPFVSETDMTQHPVTHASVGAATEFSEAQIQCFNQARELAHLTPQQQHQLEQTLIKFHDTLTDTRIGITDVYEHEIRTGNSQPVRSNPYKTSPAKREIIKQKVKDLLDQGIIVPSSSKWASPVCLVRKGKHDFRLVIDARKLNSVTERDAYPMPTIDNIISSLNGNKYFSRIDLKQAFNQVVLGKNSREKSAFITEDGLYEFTRVSFGGKNSGAIFQRVMDTVLSDYKGKCAFPYCDDIIVYSKTFSDHLRDISNVLSALHKYGLTACPVKSHFARLEIQFLGLIINSLGVKMDPERVRAIQDYPRPTDLSKLSKFLGVISWYCKFVRDLSHLAHPLNNLKKKGVKFKWSLQCDESFTKLKCEISKDTLLHFPDFSHPFYIQTDASDYGIAGKIYQIINNEHKIIAFASRSLTQTEQNYCTSKKEALAAIWACEKWHYYIDLTKFYLVSDHSALKYLFSNSQPKGQNARWLLRLQNFDYEFIFKAGKENIIPDALSRAPLPYTDPHPQEGELEITSPTASCFVSQVPLQQNLNKIGTTDSNKFDPWMLRRPDILKLEQEGDEGIQNIVQTIDSFNGKYILKDNILYADTPKGHLPVLPSRLRPLFLYMCHDSILSGHMGIGKTKNRLCELVYWPSMLKDIVEYVKSCKRCQATKPVYNKPAGFIVQPQVSQRWQCLSLDYIGPLVRSRKGNKVILVITDVYTKWVELFPLRDATAEILVRTLHDHILTRFGAPNSIVTDNATNFSGHLFKKLLHDWGIKHIFISPYHAQSNPTERVNRNLKAMLQAYCNGQHDTWDTHLSSLRFALNSAVHETTGISPAELTFGVNMTTPLQNNMLHTRGEHTDTSYSEYLRNLNDKLDVIKLQIGQTVQKSKVRQARNYNKRRRLVTYKPGDLVLKREHHLSNAENKFSGKLADRWGGPYSVHAVHNGVTLVVGEANSTKKYTVHICDVRPYVERRPDLQCTVESENELHEDDECEGTPRHEYNLRSRAQC